jgi:GT2 family glycosyltransferase
MVAADRFDQFEWDQQFDVITLIGVLEYANLFTPGDNPALAMLQRARALLKPNGKLIIAIENQLGLKYFAGAPEDHLGQPMYGIEGRYHFKQPQTFGRVVLTELLQEAGFATCEFLAPFPDYKLPISILTEAGFNSKDFDACAFAWQSARRDPQLPQFCNFSLELAWPAVFDNQMALDLANSFLIVASPNTIALVKNDVLAYHYSTERRPEFCKETVFKRENSTQISIRYNRLGSIDSGENNNSLIQFICPDSDRYALGKLLSQEFIQIVTRDGWTIDEVVKFIKRYLGILEDLAREQGVQVDLSLPNSELPGIFFDAVPQNIIIKNDGGVALIDKEWNLTSNIESGHLLLRALGLSIGSITKFGNVNATANITCGQFVDAVLAAIQMSGVDYERYMAIEEKITEQVTGRPSKQVVQWWPAHPLPMLNLNQVLAERDGQIASLNRVVTECNGQIASLTHDVAEHKRIIEERLSSLYSRLLMKEGELRHVSAQLDGVHSSLMWRIISLVRGLRDRLCPDGSWRGRICAGLVHWLKTSVCPETRRERSTGGSLDRVLKIANTILSVSPHRKYQLVSFVFKWFGSVFTHTDSYQRWKERQPPVLQDHVTLTFSPQDTPPEPLPLVRLDRDGVEKLVQSFSFSYVAQPLVSIVIPVCNHLEYTVCCLASLLKHVPQSSFEVIIVDDASFDETPNILPTIKNINYVRNEKNIGFLHSCNKGATLARGQFLVFLNNDTQVLEGWLDELVNTFRQFSDVGLVGSKLVYPNGMLQEAGAIIKPDGSAELVGLNADPARPEYNVVREVDYCSGACLLIEAEVFKTLGGFDEIYSPCYCEDSDLAFRVRKMGKRVLYQPRSVVVHHLSVSTNDSEHAKMPLVARNTDIFVQRWSDELKKLNEVRAIAFYLPQYHPIPENDQWWGKGFTEWTNVTKARPNFEGHYQPHLPADLGFYDLRVPEVREEQARLACHYGVSAFCYYYYWFAGKKLLNRPFDEMLQSGTPDFPFCICWANENWTRRWDGCEEEILIAQSHTEGDHADFIAGIAPALRDARYVRIHGKPLVIVYRLSLMPEPKRTADLWREYCVNEGIGEIYLAYVQSFERMPQGDDPSIYGFDAAIEFPPHRYPVRAECFPPLINPEYQGLLYDYVHTSENFINRPWPSYKLLKTVMPSWDNTARRQDISHVFVNATPERYEYWLRKIVEQTRRLHFGDERIVFINAWNEWAEGNHLEPDRQFGHQYLVATKNGLG